MTSNNQECILNQPEFLINPSSIKCAVLQTSCTSCSLHSWLLRKILSQKVRSSTRNIFSIPKVCILTDLRVQRVWQQLSSERSRKEAMGDEISPHGRRLLLGIWTHLFSLSHCDCLCFYQIFSLHLQLRDQMAPMHNALNHGKAWGICYV